MGILECRLECQVIRLDVELLVRGRKDLGCPSAIPPGGYRISFNDGWNLKLDLSEWE